MEYLQAQLKDLYRKRIESGYGPLDLKLYSICNDGLGFTENQTSRPVSYLDY